MKTPIRIETHYGMEQYCILQRMMEDMKVRGSVEQFRQNCLSDSSQLTEYLNFFLEDDVMAQTYPMNDIDKEGWRIYREMSDMIGCLNYFGGIRP